MAISVGVAGFTQFVTGTTITSTSRTLVVGDIVLAYALMIPTSVTCTFSKSAGTATLSAFATNVTVTNGNSFSIFSYAVCTAAGTATIRATSNSTLTNGTLIVVVYSGACAVNQATTGSGNTGTDITTTITTTYDQSWSVFMAGNVSSSGISDGTGTTGRIGGLANISGTINDLATRLGDSNAGLSPGSQAMHFTQISNATYTSVMFELVAGIAFDAASNSGYQTAQSSYSWSHACAGSSRFLAVDVEILSVPGTTVTGITYNGVALSFIGAQSTVSGSGRVECWGLAAPATGSNTIAVTLSASVASAGTAASYTGVHQSTPTEAFNSAQATNVGAADATVGVTTVADNDWVHGGVATDDTAVTANQTSRNNVTGALGSGANEDTGPKTPSGPVTVSYTGVGALATWAIAGYGIRPTTASGGGSLSRTATDAPTASDSASRTLSAPRAATEAPSATDSAARAFSGGRSAQEAPSAQQSVARTFVGGRAAQEAPSAADAAARALALARSSAEAPATSDAAARALGAARSAAEAPAASDAAARGLMLFRSAFEGVSSVDSASTRLAAARGALEAPLASDSPAASLVGFRGAAEAVALADAPAAGLSFARGAAEGVALADAAARAASFTRGAAEAAALADAAAAVVVGAAPGAVTLDPLGFADATLDELHADEAADGLWFAGGVVDALRLRSVPRADLTADCLWFARVVPDRVDIP